MQAMEEEETDRQQNGQAIEEPSCAGCMERKPGCEYVGAHIGRDHQGRVCGNNDGAPMSDTALEEA
jgi:hypothetical protein